MKEMWNSRYASEAFAYGKAPNAFFKEIIDTLNPGNLLLPAEGEGRNAVYAASVGHKVLAVDQSNSGKVKALKLAKESHVAIEYVIADLLDFRSEKTFDCIALIYAHFPSSIRKEIHEKLVSALIPGGTLIVECFHPKQLEYNSGGPKDESMLYDLSTLKADFIGLNEIYANELTILLDEGEFHQGDAAVTRYVGVKA